MTTFDGTPAVSPLSTFDGTPVAVETPTTPTTPIYVQSFCTLAELDEDLNLLGSEREARVMPKIKTASDFLQKQIGWFLPVTMTRKLNGEGNSWIKIPKMTLITSVVNDGATLVEADYIAKPEKGFWAYGPYTQLIVAPEASNIGAWSNEENDVEITGHFGLYDFVKSLDITAAASQAESATTLRVSNGSLLSPGMVIVIEQEQEYIESTAAPTAAVTTLSAAMDGEDQTIPLTDGTLINVGEILRVGLEQMKLTDINGNTGAVVRGWNRTQKASHAISSNVDVYRTYNVLRGVNGTTAAPHGSALTIYRQMVPDDINMLCRKMAGRMLKDAQGGFSGVIGDPSMGTSQYLYILPKELEDIKRNYRIINV